eukprot:GFYU01008945.1.p1 GENE.GFYU01008945.1~~GFYU01008945.1.p1  ORF type:complete len:322 (-),score=80.64 GFYU01008945.1:372-1337(-)
MAAQAQTSNVSSFETGHDDMIHDAQLDYYGKRLATASSDRTVRVFDVHEKQQTMIGELKGHDGPVWQVSWAHPKFGSMLASCSYDRTVIIWKEAEGNQWNRVFTYENHESSINSLAWAPHEFGLILACGSSDGKISILTHQADQSWDPQMFDAHKIGVNAVSWAPAAAPGSLVNSAGMTAPPTKRLASGGCDHNVKVWKLNEADGQWVLEHTLGDTGGHTDWVRDVAWAPSIGLPSNTIASCSQDRSVVIWTQADENATWTPRQLTKSEAVVWRVSWSVTGNILAVSGADNKISLWKENLDHEWQQISSMGEGGVDAAPKQ